MIARFLDPASVREFRHRWLGLYPQPVYVRMWKGEPSLTAQGDTGTLLVGIYTKAITSRELQDDAEHVAASLERAA